MWAPASCGRPGGTTSVAILSAHVWQQHRGDPELVARHLADEAAGRLAYRLVGYVE